MSGTLTPYGRQQLLVCYFAHDTFTAPSGLWLAYTVSVPVSNDDGSSLDEPTGLVRTALAALTGAHWGLSGFSEIYNKDQITPAAATAAIPVLSGWALCDSAAAGSGHCIAVGELIEPFGLDSGVAPPPTDIGGLAIGIYD